MEEDVVRVVSKSFTVAHIMTPWEYVYKCNIDDSPSEVLKVMEDKNYDVVPVVKNDVPVGFVRRDKLKDVGSIVEALEEFNLDHFISRDTQINVALELLLKRDFLFVLGDSSIVGIVTKADLGKRAVTVFFYSMLSILETEFARMIRKEVPNPLANLREDRRKKILNQIKKGRVENVDLEVLEYFYLKDLVNVIIENKGLIEKLGYRSREEVERSFDRLIEIRNRIAHPVRRLVTCDDDIKMLKESYNDIQRLFSKLRRETR